MIKLMINQAKKDQSFYITATRKASAYEQLKMEPTSI